MRKLMLIDGHNLLFKMFFGMPYPFYNDNNVNITATVGFVGNIVKMLKYIKADECLVVFDGENSRNIREDNDYKANRHYENLHEDENPFDQLKFIKAVLDYLKIKWVETDGIECDDYIAIISKMYEGDVFISSTDTDFYQLVNEKIKILKFRGKNTIFIDNDFIYKKCLILPSDYALYKAIIGDKADNIKGICKVGPKTAVKIINAIKFKRFDKFYDIYKNNLDTINHNLKLIELPNKSINVSKFKLDNYKVEINNFKNLKTVVSITNKVK